VSTPSNGQMHATLFEIGTTRQLVIVMTFDREGSTFTMTRDGSHTVNGVTYPNYAVDYTCGTGSGAPVVVSRQRNVTADLDGAKVIFLNGSKRVVLEEAPDNWVKCTP